MNSVMLIIWLCSCICLIVGFFRGANRIRISSDFLKKNSNELPLEERRVDYEKVAIIIPVYEEQNVIEKSVESFMPLAQCGIDIYYVTTQRETSNVTTKDVLEKILKRYNDNKVHVIDCPYKSGVMAHQLNYCIDQLSEETICFIYNVDSVIDIRTVNYVLEHRELLEKGVFQQYAYSYISSQNALINAAISWQNRWSISYELPKTICAGGKTCFFNYNYVIGHGLVFSKRMYTRFNHFSEKEINEDNVLGYVLNFKGIPIYPIPFLEKVDFAYNLSIYIRQQSTWFNGPLYAFKYYRELRRTNVNFPKFKMLIVALLNFKMALNWLVFPICCVVSIIAMLVTNNLSRAIILLLLIIGYVRLLNRWGEKCLQSGLTDFSEKSKNYTHCVFWLFIHTLGPMLTIYKIIKRKNNQINKFKTIKVQAGE